MRPIVNRTVVQRESGLSPGRLRQRHLRKKVQAQLNQACASRSSSAQTSAMHPEITIRPALLRDCSASSTRTTLSGRWIAVCLGPRKCVVAVAGALDAGRVAIWAGMRGAIALGFGCAPGGCSQSARRYKLAETTCGESMLSIEISPNVCVVSTSSWCCESARRLGLQFQRLHRVRQR